MKITLRTIAEDTGLSVSTVSRALSQNGKISRKNVRKVFESAQRLNYPIYQHAAAAKFRSNFYIAVVTHCHPGEFYASFFDGFAQAATDSNTHFAMFNVSDKVSHILRFIDSIKRKHFDAAVIFLPGLSKSDYLEIIDLAGDFPIVSAAPLATPVMDTIVFDNYSGGHLVARHFHERGYKKIGSIQGPSSEVETHLRKNGLTDYCEQNGLDLVWNYKSDYDIASGKASYEDFKRLKNKPEAIFAGNDALALGFMHSALRDGLSIPGDVAIAGYDNIPSCEYQNPTLTSVRTPYTDLGHNVLDLITKQLKQPDTFSRHSGSSRLIPVTLIERESS